MAKIKFTVPIIVLILINSLILIDPFDFKALAEILFFNDTTNRVCIEIPIIDDDIVENPEDFMVLISTTDPGVNISSPLASSVIILDNDLAVIGFEMESYSVDESLGYVEVCAALLNSSLELVVEVSLSTRDLSAQGEK